MAKPQVKKSHTGEEFGPIIQSMTYSFKFSFVGKNMFGKENNQNQRCFPV